MSIFRYKFRALAAVAALAAPIYALSSRQPSPVSIATLAQSSAASMGTELRHLSEVLLATPARLAGSDVARLNLICTEGLPGADGLDLDKCLPELARWAERISDPTSPEQSDDFFADSRDLFLHGLLGPSRRGTCSSMPVLYVALGRRLGYPLKLVTTKAHLFARWDSPSERFNVEATGKGMNRYDDEHFKGWPFPITDEEMRLHGYLKSLSPTEEAALFLSLRGNCLRHAGRLQEALTAYSCAARLAPGALAYHYLHADAQQACWTASPKAFTPKGYALPPGLTPAGTSFGNRVGINPDPNPLMNLRQSRNTSTQ